LPQSVTFSIGFQDVAAVGEPIQQGACEALGAEDLRPFCEGQVRGQHEAVMLIGPADDLEE